MSLQHLSKNLKDYRFYCLSFALLAMLALFIKPSVIKQQPVYNFTFIIDITRSMNARDYQLNEQAVSRLQFVKQALGELILKLPCQSKVGLGIFTERHSTLLFEPIEVCSSYAEIDSVIDSIDWRMAWAADSRISKGLASTITQLQERDSHLVFLTDGQEAPPVNPRYKPDFSDLKGKLKGLLVGVGGLQNVPIPKYNNQGQQQGVYQQDDVPHRSTFGMAPTSSVPAGNFNARNAPFGGAIVTGDQHLTRLYEPYLQQLSKEVAWSYHRLESSELLNRALQTPLFAQQKQVQSDIRPYFAVLVLILLSLVYFPYLVFKRKPQNKK
ncbi:MAG: VWA domain-containing protein [Methyloprofundus sp.]|nr:VWA domain-containing protein [Methyloprofundus sp.]MDT8426480.1 VWA domain-containing protein [Methyloprofundus sp.]